MATTIKERLTHWLAQFKRNLNREEYERGYYELERIINDLEESPPNDTIRRLLDIVSIQSSQLALLAMDSQHNAAAYFADRASGPTSSSPENKESNDVINNGEKNLICKLKSIIEECHAIVHDGIHHPNIGYCEALNKAKRILDQAL